MVNWESSERRRSSRRGSLLTAEPPQANDHRVFTCLNRKLRIGESRNELVSCIAAEGVRLARDSHDLVELLVSVDVMVTDDRIIARWDILEFSLDEALLRRHFVDVGA